MWRNESEVALNDLAEAVREAADFYADAAGQVGDAALAGLFGELADRRDRFAARLGEAIRRGGDLPSVPDADGETLRRLGSRLRAALSVDETQRLLSDRIDAEERLSERVEQALRQPLEAPTVALLTELRDDTGRAASRMRGRQPSG